MRRQSKKKLQEIQEANEAREEFSAEFFICMVPRCQRIATDTHEICRGAHRSKAYRDRRCWLRLCRFCHDAMGDYQTWPIARQLTVKAIADPDYYDREFVNETRGRDRNAITENEVWEFVTVLL